MLEMEAGPYLSAIYEIVNPSRHPKTKLSTYRTARRLKSDFLHYASDTP